MRKVKKKNEHKQNVGEKKNRKRTKTVAWTEFLIVKITSENSYFIYLFIWVRVAITLSQ